MKENTSRRHISDDVYLNGSTPTNVDSAFRKIKKHWTNFLIWRVEDMNLTALPKDQFGIFNDEDSYVIYSASQSGQSSGVDTVSREIKTENLEYHAHFWLGSETTPNKSGVAAFKTVELDNILNGIVTQHRETQDYESSRFKSYFKNGMRIIKPINSAKINPFPKLYRVKGKCCPILTEIGEITWTSFNSSSILLLHTDKYMFLWVGRSSNSTERIHALKIAEELKTSTPNTEIVFVDDGYEKTLSKEYKTEFDKIMPLDKRLVLPDAEQNGHTISDDYNIRLYKCSENEGKYRVTEIKDGPLKQKDLNSDGVFIIDQGLLGIWIWVGRRSSMKEKAEALRNARGFVKKKKYPSFTRVARVVDGYEPSEFKYLFPTWKVESNLNGRVKPTIMVSKFDAQAMEDRPALAAETQLVDNGSGILTVWRVENPRILEIPKERHGYFFAGDCYIVLYSYATKREKHLLYYWLGNDATQEDIDCTILKLTQIENDLQRIGFQARIIQGYEPAHFLQIFHGRLMIFHGKGSAFDASGKNMKHPSQYLVQTYGTTKYESKAVQVPLKCISLNSNYCFLLVRGKYSFIWCGQYSNGDQREMAKGFIKRDVEIILEGKEKQEFFDLLGGKTAYRTDIMKKESDARGSRLFSCFNLNGVFTVEEIHQFTQKNLIPEDIMLLDAYEALYIWIGNLSTKEDQRLSLKSAIDYLQMDPSGRNMNIPIIQVKQADEPPTFTGFFPSWNKKYWKHYRTFPRLRRDIEMLRMCNGDHKTNGENHTKTEFSEFDQYDKYPINILLVQNDKLPARVDPLQKELHLTHDDFLSVFKMSYTEFQKLPKWKQQEMKKRVKLF